MKSKKDIRTLLLEQLEGRNTHVAFDQAIQGLTFKQVGIRVEGIPHTIWELIEHIRIAQDDILEFCKNPDYEDLDWPDEYWPAESKPESKEAFEQSLQLVRDGINEMRELIMDPTNNLQRPFDHGDGQTLFREAMLIVDHNAYHIGQIVLIRRLLGSW
ncbi:DinB family protein [Fodinibius sp. Rm-B-1B1-1]|uniref:DinB family protein n=1 Tax=Fodinibius alkaliphilus TaxID=3140241 RepID=UPI00315AA616